MRSLIFFELAALLLTPALARADDAPRTTVRVRFATTADADAIQRAACAAETSIDVGGVKSAMAVRVERADATVACTPPTDAKYVLVVHIAAAAPTRDVMLEMDLGKETTLQAADEMLEALHATSVAFEQRIPVPPPPTVRLTGPLSQTLTGFGIGLGITGIGTIAASYIWLAVLVTQPGSCTQPLSVKVPVFNWCATANDYLQTEVLEIAGVATVVLGATLALVGQLRVTKPSKTARFVPIIAPIRGGVSTGLSITF